MIINRNFKKGDTARLVELNNLCFDEKHRPEEELLRRYIGVSDIWLAWTPTNDGPKIIGYALVDPGYDSAYLTQIAVHPDFQRRGIAGNLLREVCGYFTYKTSGVAGKYRNIRLHVAIDNPAQRLYYNQGFRVFDIAKKFYKDESDALYMKKEL